ncbi:MAG: hypothetical protein KGJ89_01690 [Patescibacteria group bacterium]|nr:hypothetical protein [Patescibacteria group bacterium]MDE2015590.1 hypothetical protein [Patescibacteria group bacterium]MDE2226647.1 hypothetical protein [Patescibacteria group bacterium]
MAKDSGNIGYKSPWEESSETSSEKSKIRLEPPKKHGEWHIFIIGGIVFVLLAAGAYYLYSLSPRGADVGMRFINPSQVLLGEPFTLTASYSNYSNYVLKDVSLSLVLPDGVYLTGQSQDQRVIEQTLGDLGPGSVSQQDFNLIITDGSDSVKNITAKLKYSAPNSSAQFEYDAQADVLVGQPAVSLNMTVPQGVFNGQDFDIKIGYSNNTNKDFNNLRLKLDYPPIFQFTRSTTQSDGNGNNSWDLGTLAPGSAGTISVTGNILGPEKAFVSFNAGLSADYLGQTYQINSQSANTSISSTPLSLSVNMSGGGAGEAAKPGDFLLYTLNYQNNSDVVMQNAVITANPSGDMLDLSTIQTQGSFSSSNNTVTWAGANTPQLLNIAPGQSGSVSFKVKVKNAYPIRLISDKNYTLKVAAQIGSPTVPTGTNASKTIALANLESKVVGNVVLSSTSYWRDAASGILNSGPYPPRDNQPTDYTVHWDIINYATDVTNVTVSASLPYGTRLTGAIKSNMDTEPSYDANSGVVTWQIPFLPATKGIVGAPAEAIFQIENTPSTNQVGQTIQILGTTNIQWTDSFTGQQFQSSAVALDTNLPYDTTVAGVQNKKVQP